MIRGSVPSTLRALVDEGGNFGPESSASCFFQLPNLKSKSDLELTSRYPIFFKSVVLVDKALSNVGKSSNAQLCIRKH